MNLLIWRRSLGEKIFAWINSLFERLLRDRFFLTFFLLGLLFVIIDWLFAYGMFRMLGDQQIVLHYSVKFGADNVGHAKGIFWMPGLSTVVLFMNLILAQLIDRRKTFISYLVLFAALIFAQITLSSLYSLYLINFR